MLAMVSSPSRTSLTYSINPAMKHRGSSFRRDAETSTRDACATLITGSERLALAADSGAASVSYGVSEWGVGLGASVSDCLKRRL